MKHWVIGAMVMTTLLGQTAGAAGDERVVAGVGHPSFPDNACGDFTIGLTYVAEEVDGPTLYKYLESQTHFSASTAIHITSTSLGERYDLRGTGASVGFKQGDPKGALAAINRLMFGTDTPSVGAVSSGHKTEIHIDYGSCLKKGSNVCVGGTTAPEGSAWQPPLGVPINPFPYDRPCRTVPEGKDYCFFGQPSATVDLGTVMSGREATGKTSVAMQCHGGGGDYTVSLSNGGGGITDETGTFSVSVNGKGLPAAVHGPSGTTNLDIGVTGKMTPGWTGPITVSGVLILDAQ